MASSGRTQVHGISFHRLLAALTVLVFSSACTSATAYRVHPGFSHENAGIKVVGVLPPKAEVSQLDIGGKKTKMEDRSIEAENNVFTAILQELNTRPGLAVETLSGKSLSDAAKANLAETQALFGAITQSIREHVYRENRKIEAHDYSLGKEVGDLGFGDVDALLIFRAENSVPTPQLAVILIAAGLLVFAAPFAAVAAAPLHAASATGIVFFGPAVSTGILGGASIASAAAVESGGGASALEPRVEVALLDPRTGRILWYNRNIDLPSAHHLTHPDSASKTLKALLEDLPVGK